MQNFNLLYMAKPKFGGWVSFTCHLSLKENFNIYRITKRDEKKKRPLGYNCYYQNLSILSIAKLQNILITAIDKNYYKYLEFIPSGTYIVIHDPTEYNGPKKSILRKHLQRFNIITIRKKVQLHLENKYNLKSIFLLHPFYQFQKKYTHQSKTGSISISRIDYDKNIDIIITANDKLQNTCDIYGFPNDLYVYRKLKDTNYLKYYKGRFLKSFDELDNLLSQKKYVVDMSSIKNDGDGSQYTFLEAIYMNCILILNQKWVGENSIFKHGNNCLVVHNSDQLIETLNSKSDVRNILENSKKILTPHINVNWKLNYLHMKFFHSTINETIDS